MQKDDAVIRALMMKIQSGGLLTPTKHELKTSLLPPKQR